MRTYRNVFVHGVLDRHLAIALLRAASTQPQLEHEIPPVDDLQVAVGGGRPTNRGEVALGRLLAAAGFPEFEDQHPIHIGTPYETTTPDLYYEDADGDVCLAIYLDGLSKAVHGSRERSQEDRLIRHQLEAIGVDVIEIASSDLNDPEAMRLHFRRIASKLRRRDLRERLDGDTGWFTVATGRDALEE